MPMGFSEWADRNIEAGGRGLRSVYDNWQAGMAESERSPDYKGTGAPKQVVGQAGTGTAEQQRTGAMASGSFGDDHPDAGNANTGNPYLDELRSGRVAGSEDWRRFSNADLLAWQPYYVGGGNFQNQYGDMVGKPMDSGPNTPKDMDGMGKPRIGGGGGGGGGQPQPGQPAAAAAPSQAVDPLQKYLEDMASGQAGMFGDVGREAGAAQNLQAQSLEGGGVWTNDQDANAQPGAPGAPPAPPTLANAPLFNPGGASQPSTGTPGPAAPSPFVSGGGGISGLFGGSPAKAASPGAVAAPSVAPVAPQAALETGLLNAGGGSWWKNNIRKK